jgi:exonuclease SbcC
VILDRLRLKNFRSYIDEEIVFSPGVSLFEGDIGSGKSSLLFAVEFALFGPADVPTSHLLRAGVNEGSIELSFRARGKAYTVGRHLKRDKRGNLSQKDAYLIRDGSREDLSTTQLREAIIQVLGFREVANPRTKSQIFRYGIFTPQEEMKAILEQDAEERKQTLRRAFGIEEFKRARENAGLILRALAEIGAKSEGRLEAAPRLEEEVKAAKEAHVAAGVRLEESKRDLVAAREAVAKMAAAITAVEQLEKQDRETERAESAKRAERATADERRNALERELGEIAKVEEQAPPLRKLAGHLAEREKRLAEQERLDRENRELKEAARTAQTQAASAAERVEDIEKQVAEIARVLERTEEVRDGQLALEAARKALAAALEEHTRAKAAARQLKDAESRLTKARRIIERGAKAGKDAEHLVPTISAGEAAKGALEGLEEKRGAAQAGAGAVRMELARFEKEHADFSSLDGKARCPKCKQEISREHLEGHREELERDVSGAKRRLGKSQAEVRTLDKEWGRQVKLHDAGVEAMRSKAALDKDAARAKEAQAEAEGLVQLLDEAKALAARGETASRAHGRLQREVNEKAHFEKDAGAIESAKKREIDAQKRHDSARRDLGEAKAQERAAADALKAHAFDAAKTDGIKREVREAREAAVRLEGIEAKLAKRAEVESNLKQARARLSEVDRALAEAGKARAELGARLAAAGPDTVRTQNREAIEARAGADAKQNGATAQLAEAEERVERAATALSDLSGERGKLDRIRHTRDFIEQCFGPSMGQVESQVLMDLNSQFNARFQDYFGRLMEGAPVDVQIDEDFTPEVVHGGEPLPLMALSGGERTSIALAYRLALNILVSRAAGMETPDLLVLDEPTDGFSTEQLARVGELLRELDCQQVILVSHERELETCADHVFEVVKDGTVSRVVAR